MAPAPLCELCLALSPCYQALRECCQVRLLATMPTHAVESACQRARQVGGREAEKQLRAKVSVEWRRQNNSRLAAGKQAVRTALQFLRGNTDERKEWSPRLQEAT